LEVAPPLVDEQRLAFAGFFSQQSVIESATGNQANIVMATQPPATEIYRSFLISKRPKRSPASPQIGTSSRAKSRHFVISRTWFSATH
jgi:hypothetical protein